MNASRDRAVSTLRHYVELLMRSNGLKVDRDTAAELAQLVDDLIDAAVDAMADAEHKR
jgi:hypothetical protein